MEKNARVRLAQYQEDMKPLLNLPVVQNSNEKRAKANFRLAFSGLHAVVSHQTRRTRPPYSVDYLLKLKEKVDDRESRLLEDEDARNSAQNPITSGLWLEDGLQLTNVYRIEYNYKKCLPYYKRFPWC